MKAIYSDQDADLALIQSRHAAVLGFGNQGRAHALCLRDSGIDVRVGLRPESSAREEALSLGLRVVEPSEACAEADLVMMLVPDTVARTVYAAAVAPHLRSGHAVFFAHGFNIHYGYIQPPADVDVCMVAPKGPGRLVRQEFEDGRGVPALVAVDQDASGKAFALALAYARAIGATRAGALSTTFAEETETDLFGEQAVLCGGLGALVTAGYETLVEAGYSAEAAYFECLHEVKLIADLIHVGGLNYMRRMISDTAEYGDYTRGRRIITDRTREDMRQVLAEIRDGSFAREWIHEDEDGRARFHKFADEASQHPIEEVGGRLRQLMDWLQPGEAQVRSR